MFRRRFLRQLLLRIFGFATYTCAPISKYLPENIGKKRGYDASDVNLPSQGGQINFVPFRVDVLNEKIADEDELDLRYAKNRLLIFRSPLKKFPNHFHQTHHFIKPQFPMSSEIWFEWVAEKLRFEEKVWNRPIQDSPCWPSPWETLETTLCKIWDSNLKRLTSRREPWSQTLRPPWPRVVEHSNSPNAHKWTVFKISSKKYRQKAWVWREWCQSTKSRWPNQLRPLLGWRVE